MPWLGAGPELQSGYQVGTNALPDKQDVCRVPVPTGSRETLKKGRPTWRYFAFPCSALQLYIVSQDRSYFVVNSFFLFIL